MTSLNKFINFEVEEVDVVEEDPNSQFATAKIHAFSSGENRHSMICSEEVLQRTANSLDNVPLLYNLDGLMNEFDFGTHTDPDKNLIAGFVLPKTQEFFRLEDGRLGVSVLAKIWKRYASKAIDIFKEKKNKKVSVEMDLRNSRELPNGFIEMLDFAYAGVTLLGEFITEASPNAHIEILSFAKKNNDEYKKAVSLEFGLSRYEDIDFSIPSSVKSNAKQGLELHKKFGRGGTSVGLASARYLVSNQTIAPEKVRHVAKYFPRHAGDNLDDKESNGWIAWLLWGGNSGRSWSTKIVERMNKIDGENMSFFSDEKNIENEKKEVELNKTEENVEEKEMAVEEEKKTEEMAVDTKTEEKEETPVEEKVETKEEEKEEEKKKVEMSLNSYADVPFIMGMLKEETEEHLAMEKEFSEGSLDMAKFFAKINEKMCKMAKELEVAKKDGETFMAENVELKKFKADIEEKQFGTTVMGVLKEIEYTVPQDKYFEIKEDAKNFSIDNVDGWVNKARAIAFSYTKGVVKEEGELELGVVKFALPFAIENTKKTDSLW